MTQIAFSILSSDFLHLGRDLQRVENIVDRLHFDVMDGHFVEDITFGVPILQQLQTNLPIDTHLMVTNPEKHIKKFAPYSSRIYFHIEASEDPKQLAQMIQKHGSIPGIVLSPETQVEEVFPYLTTIQHILIMSVHPGAGGQAYLPETLSKIAAVKKQYPDTSVMVDGGMNAETSIEARNVGVDTIVSGSYISRSESAEKAVSLLRGKL